MVNGPEDDSSGWLSVDWQRAEDDVRRLRQTALLASQKAALADWVQHRPAPWTPRPVKRVFIPKANGRQSRRGEVRR